MQALWITDTLTEEEAALRQAARRFVEREVAPVAAKAAADPRTVTPELLRQAARAGLTAPDIPERYGGLGLPRRSSSLVVEELVRDFSFGVSLGVHVGIGMWPTLLYGTEAQRTEWLPRILSAEALAAYALTEPGAGSDAMGVQMRARRDGDDVVLDGQKLWISNAGFAGLFTAFARLPEGMTAFLVPGRTPGLTIGSEERKMGIHGSSTAAVFFDGVRVPLRNLLGEVGRGHKIAFGVLNLGRLKLAAASVGMARQALGEAVLHAKDRKQFGQPLIAFPAVREMLARSAALLYVAESVVYLVCHALDEKLTHADGDTTKEAAVVDGAALECSLAKVVASEALGKIADDAVQVHGGLGFGDTAVSRIYRDARVCRIFEGTTQVNSLVVVERFIHRAAAEGFPDAGPREAWADRWMEGGGRSYAGVRHADFLDIARTLATAVAALGGTKAFLASVNKPEVQQHVWPLAAKLVQALAFEAVLGRDGWKTMEMACRGVLAEPAETIPKGFTDEIVDAL